MESLILTSQVTGPKLNENAQTYATSDANAKYRVDAGRSTDPHLKRNIMPVKPKLFFLFLVLNNNVELNPMVGWKI